MRSSRVGRVVAVAACLVTGVAVALPAGVLAAPAGHVAPRSASHPVGFFVTGQGRIAAGKDAAAFVRDRRGGEHVVTIRRTTGSDRGQLVYRTKLPGATRWVTDRVPGVYRDVSRVRVEALLNNNRGQVYAVVYGCDGAFAAETPIRSARLPKPAEVAPVDSCRGTSEVDRDPPIDHAAPMFGNHLGVLLPDPARHGQSVIWKGKPGLKAFHPQHAALPTAEGFSAVMITTGRYNHFVVVGYGSNATTKGIYVVTRRGFSSPWLGPTRIATLGRSTSDYTIEAIASHLDKTWVGLLRTGSRRGALYIDRGDGSNQWTGAFALPHTTSHDRSLRLVYNGTSGHLHAAFTRVDRASKVTGSGIMKERLLGHWTRPTFLTHWYRDAAAQITFTRHGRAVIGYRQR